MGKSSHILSLELVRELAKNHFTHCGMYHTAASLRSLWRSEQDIILFGADRYIKANQEQATIRMNLTSLGQEIAIHSILGTNLTVSQLASPGVVLLARSALCTGCSGAPESPP